MNEQECHLATIATTTPLLEARGALEVLADHYLEQNWRTGLVTSDRHNPECARLKFLGHVFCRAWRELMGPFAPYAMPGRIGGALSEHQCWVRLSQSIDLTQLRPGDLVAIAEDGKLTPCVVAANPWSNDGAKPRTG